MFCMVLYGGLHFCPITRRSWVQFPVGEDLLPAPVGLLQVLQFLTHLKKFSRVSRIHSLRPWPNALLKIFNASVWQNEASFLKWVNGCSVLHPSLRGWCFLPVLCRGGADQFPVWLHRQGHRAQPSSSWPATHTARWTHIQTCLRTLKGNYNGSWVIVIFWPL